jgi:hypothetical protein
MLIIEVQTPAFSGSFFHESEISSALVVKSRSEAANFIEEKTEFLKLCMVDQGQVSQIDDLTTSQALIVWAEFCATKPTRWEIPNEVPAWL